MQLRMSPAAHPNSSRLSVLGAGTLSPHNSGILPPSLPPAPAELSQERRYRSDVSWLLLTVCAAFCAACDLLWCWAALHCLYCLYCLYCP
jgi:hypothetical protein